MRVGIISPRREACGVSTYTSELVRRLESLVEISYVTDPAGFRPDMNDVDLVHVQHEYFVFGGVAPWKNRFAALLSQIHRPVVMTVHEIVEPVGNLAYSAAVRLTNRAQFKSSKIRSYLVHTSLDRRRLEAAGAPSERIRVIRHGVPDAPPMPSREEARRSLGLDEEFVMVIYGFISRKKGHLAALQALTLLPREVILIIAGGKHPDDATGYVDEVRAHAAELGLRARITGYLQDRDVASVMAAADLVLAPFTATSGSGSLAMALACGKPILASDIEPHREILVETPDSLELCPNSPGGIAGAVNGLRNDNSRRKDLVRGALRYAASHSFLKAAEDTAAVYRAVIAETTA